MESEICRNHVKTLAANIRINILKMTNVFGQGHVGGSMSIADLLGVLYGGVMKIDPKNPKWEQRDYFVCSKGHTGPAVYGALAARGYIPEEEMNTLNKIGTNLPSHCDRLKTPGIDMTAGSLGQGLSAAVGIALGLKMSDKDNRCYVVIGDGESQEGEIWEALMFAAHSKLDNLILFVDYNGEQLDGRTEEINKIDNYTERFKSFGWNSVDVDGHNVDEIINAIENAQGVKGMPSAIVLHTIKGKGSFAEGIFNHNITVSDEEAKENIALIKKCLDEVK